MWMKEILLKLVPINPLIWISFQTFIYQIIKVTIVFHDIDPCVGKRISFKEGMTPI